MTVACRRLLTGPLLGKCHWRASPEPGAPPLPVIEDLDILRDLAVSLLTGLVATMMHQLILQRSSETLHRRVVITVTLPTHGRGHSELPQLLLIVSDTILGEF